MNQAQHPVQTKAEVLARLRQQQLALRALGVAQLGLFGSFVRDEATPASDVDVLVDFEEGRKTYRALCAVAELLEETLGRRVEILTRAGLSPFIGPHILNALEDVLTAT
ncbi:nucleotidyltransferase family protein [Hymenobacter weizhouensis]|uniref:nucleotidyltransferase family protein n=1 Tax=Hymenobacter sp. YIM 151500-1 TaxID=2987689 RepID=UPI002225EA36|nr:nucleotidyltransferase family protein [Hymenobacter sp. YIM 151500-1]UYZ62236.1 nucleotidyltransferase family protein [Hymenobacter sp. YIM 151500-1]